MTAFKSLSFFGFAAFAAACAARDAHPAANSSPTREPAVAQPAATPVAAPRDAIFLAESGVVTFAWTMQTSGSDVQRGEGKLVFDRWGHRQATSGYPGPTGDKVVLVDQVGITTYMPSLHYAVTTHWNGLETFSPEERRTLQDMFTPAKQSQGQLKSVAGMPCLEILTEQHLPTHDVSTHSGCSARGIELETHDAVSGGMLSGFKMSMLAIKVELGVKASDSLFAIPVDVKRIGMGNHPSDKQFHERVLATARMVAALNHGGDAGAAGSAQDQ